MKTRNRMLLRDMWHLRGQLLATALVVAGGLASFVSMRCTYDSLRIAQAEYYQAYRFANVFAQLKRAPQSLARRISEIDGVAAVSTRVVYQRVMTLPVQLRFGPAQHLFRRGVHEDRSAFQVYAVDTVTD